MRGTGHAVVRRRGKAAVRVEHDVAPVCSRNSSGSGLEWLRTRVAQDSSGSRTRVALNSSGSGLEWLRTRVAPDSVAGRHTLRYQDPQLNFGATRVLSHSSSGATRVLEPLESWSHSSPEPAHTCAVPVPAFTVECFQLGGGARRGDTQGTAALCACAHVRVWCLRTCARACAVRAHVRTRVCVLMFLAHRSRTRPCHVPSGSWGGCRVCASTSYRAARSRGGT